MSLELKIVSIIYELLIIFFINYLLIKNKISIKYGIVWLIPSLLMLLFTIIPGFLSSVTKLFGFQTASNMIFALLIALLIFITICLTIIVSYQKNQLRLLIQEVSVLKYEIQKNDLKKKEEI